MGGVTLAPARVRQVVAASAVRPVPATKIRLKLLSQTIIVVDVKKFNTLL